MREAEMFLLLSCALPQQRMEVFLSRLGQQGAEEGWRSGTVYSPLITA